MNGKKLFTVFMVATALSLFSSFAFGDSSRCKVDWCSVAAFADLQVDDATIQVSLMEDAILRELNDPNLCYEQRSLYETAYSHLNEAKVHIERSYTLCRTLADSRNDQVGGVFLIQLFSELTRTSESCDNALQFYYEARFWVCKA